MEMSIAIDRKELFWTKKSVDVVAIRSSHNLHRLNWCGVGDGDRYCCENWLNWCGVGDGDRYCCENWLNCCGVGDGDRYCCENY